MTSPHPGLSRELADIGRHTRKCNGVSAGIHLLLLLWFVFAFRVAPEDEGLTEITFIDPVQPLPAALPTAVAKSDPSPTTRIERQSVDPRKAKFEREVPVADLAPQPQELKRVDDKINERLASLQTKTLEKPVDIAALSTPSPVGRPKLAGASDAFRPPERAELSRTELTKPEPVALSRNKRRIVKAEIIPSPVNAMPVERARPERTHSDAQRVLAGAKLTGPVADRPVLSYDVPDYPEWAKKEAVEGSVTIYFVVLPDGSVKENIMVEKTAGFADFDDNAVRALLSWRFAPLKGGGTGEQWGTITFNYRLSDVN
ncbi:MAG: TonB family protein [Candidatus Latescibacterota bacterium]|nr:MAG: TonB family protein [Candidatus Latescibacterota bacterium]